MYLIIEIYFVQYVRKAETSFKIDDQCKVVKKPNGIITFKHFKKIHIFNKNLLLLIT